MVESTARDAERVIACKPAPFPASGAPCPARSVQLGPERSKSRAGVYAYSMACLHRLATRAQSAAHSRCPPSWRRVCQLTAWPLPAGPRKRHEGCTDEVQGILSMSRCGRTTTVKVSLLAAGWLIGPRCVLPRLRACLHSVLASNLPAARLSQMTVAGAV